jgi:hypothetical protein
MVALTVGPFEIGSNTMWLGAHGMLMLVILISLAFLFGAIWFSRRADEQLVRGLKAASMTTFIALVLLMITGLVPDIGFGEGASFSGSFHTDFGKVQSTVTNDNLSAFTGPLLFDVMEHVSFIVPGLAALLCFLIWHYGRRVVEERAIRGATLSVLVLTVGWVLVIGNLGLYVTKVLTFPYTR